jgi:hypothetical protein
MPGSERIELGGFGVFENGVLIKNNTLVEEAETPDENGTVKEDEPIDEDGKEDSE